MCLRATTAEALRQLLCPADLAIGDPDLRAAVDQLGGQRGTDAGRATGDECDLSRHARCHCERLGARRSDMRLIPISVSESAAPECRRAACVRQLGDDRAGSR